MSLTSGAGLGDTITLWGSGLGPVSGDEATTQTRANLEGIPIEVEIGGRSAEVIYRGRSVEPGLDQIEVVVPARVYPGCYVSVTVRIGDTVSNTATIPVSASGRACNDAHTGFMGSRIAGKNSVSMAEIEFGMESPFIPLPMRGPYQGAGRFDANFHRYTAEQLAARTAGKNPSLGSCAVYSFGGPVTNLANPMQPTPNDAGDAVNFDGIPAPFQDGSYSLSDGFQVRSGTSYRIDNAAGGPDVGPFKMWMAVAGSGGHGDSLGRNSAGVATWNNMNSISTVNRSQGVTLTWTPSQNFTNYIQISGVSVAAAGDPTVGAAFYCTAVNSGQFTVPAAVLLALPASTPVSGNLGNQSTLSLATYGNFDTFTAAGIDLGFVSGYAKVTLRVGYE